MWRHLSALLFASSALALALPAAATPSPLDQIAVIVNDGVILNSDVDARTADLRFQLEQRKAALPPIPQLRAQAREQLILEALQLQLAERNGIRPDDAAINATLTAMARENGMTLDVFRAKLDSTPGTSFASVRAAAEREQVIDRLRQRRMGERIRITDADIAQFMATPAGIELNRQLDAQLKPAAKAQAPAAPKPAELQFLVTQITVPLEEDLSAKQQARLTDLAQRLLAAQRSGMSPEEAIDSLRGKAAEAAIEELGWRTEEQLPTLLVEPLKKTLAGEKPDLIRSPRGWHLLWLADRRELKSPDASLPPPPPAPTTVVTQRQVRHILMRPNDLQSSDDIRQAMSAIHAQLKAGGDFAEIARLKSQDPGSAVKGGDLGWVSPGDMVPEFDRMIGKTAIKAISEPFQSSYGWHILRVEGERKQDMRESILKDRARQILYARAYDEELGAWLRELRAEAYVDFRGQR